MIREFQSENANSEEWLFRKKSKRNKGREFQSRKRYSGRGRDNGTGYSERPSINGSVFRTIHHTVVAEAAAAEAIDKVDTSPTNGSVFMNQHE